MGYFIYSFQGPKVVLNGNACNAPKWANVLTVQLSVTRKLIFPDWVSSVHGAIAGGEIDS